MPDSKSRVSDELTHRNSTHTDMIFRNPDNQPYNKRGFEYDNSYLTAKFHRAVGHWVDVKVEETTTSLKGHTQTRRISFCLDRDEAHKIGKFLSEC